MKGKKAILVIFIIVILNAILATFGHISISSKVVQTESGVESSMNVLDSAILKKGQTIKLKAEDIYGNETFVEVTPEIAKVREEENMDRSYDSFLEFPYAEMSFADEDVYAFIKSAYASVNWYTEYELGDLTQYDVYKEKYKEFLNNDVPFLNPEIGKEMYINDFLPIKIYDGKTVLYDKNFYDYYYFDMDKDGAPELCISGEDFISIFKYDISQGTILLWKQIEPSYYSLNGSGAIRWENGSGNVFYNLDENGEEVCSVFFMVRGTYSKEKEQRENVYLVSLPKYTEKLKDEYEENITCQGYYDKGQSVYYFRVTESQYDELTEDYYQAEEIAIQGLKSVTYSYAELFEE